MSTENEKTEEKPKKTRGRKLRTKKYIHGKTMPLKLEVCAEDIDTLKDYDYDELGRVWKDGKEILLLLLTQAK